MKIGGALFTVGHSPFCVWDWDMPQTNLNFVKSIDGNYFEYIAEVHADNIEGDTRYQAATALRAAWYHGLETMFALICASLQAPECIVGWMEKYEPRVLRNMILSISKGTVDFIVKCPIYPVTWVSISDEIYRRSDEDEDRIKQTKKLYASLWERFASDFVDENNCWEYNSIKHGVRISPGGFSLSIGLEHEYAVSPPPDEIHMLGTSKFGNSFPRLETIGPSKKNRNFKIKHSSINWSPQTAVPALQLISWSITNLKSYLLLRNGVSTNDIKFFRPEDDAMFEKPWDFSPGVLNMSMDSRIDEKMIQKLSSGEILSRLHRQFSTRTNATNG